MKWVLHNTNKIIEFLKLIDIKENLRIYYLNLNLLFNDIDVRNIDHSGKYKHRIFVLDIFTFNLNYIILLLNIEFIFKQKYSLLQTK